MMRRLASLVAVLLLICSAAPVLACVSGGAMTREESACCQAMHHQCTGMAKMNCCRTETRGQVHSQMTSSAPAIEVRWLCVARLNAVVGANPAAALAALQPPMEHSPPGLLSKRINILRI